MYTNKALLAALLISCADARTPSDVGTDHKQGLDWWTPGEVAELDGCLRLTVRDSAGSLVQGAEIITVPVSYQGQASTAVTEPDGTACVPVLRDEGPDEDNDGDGLTGEAHQNAVRVLFAGNLYAGPLVNDPSASGLCGGVGCLDVPVTLSQVLAPSPCAISGQVLKNGLPVAGAVVNAFDDSVDEETRGSCTSCTHSVLTDSSGSFSLSLQTRDTIRNVHVEASWSESSGTTENTFTGDVLLDGCPSQPTTIEAELALVRESLSVAINGSQISWSPNVPVDSLVVSNEFGDTSWKIRALPGQTFTSPITIGSLPATAIQVFPAEGQIVPPIEPSDRLNISGRYPEDGHWVLPGFPGNQQPPWNVVQFDDSPSATEEIDSLWVYLTYNGDLIEIRNATGNPAAVASLNLGRANGQHALVSQAYARLYRNGYSGLGGIPEAAIRRVFAIDARGHLVEFNRHTVGVANPRWIDHGKPPDGPLLPYKPGPDVSYDQESPTSPYRIVVATKNKVYVRKQTQAGLDAWSWVTHDVWPSAAPGAEGKIKFFYPNRNFGLEERYLSQAGWITVPHGAPKWGNFTDRMTSSPAASLTFAGKNTRMMEFVQADGQTVVFERLWAAGRWNWRSHGRPLGVHQAAMLGLRPDAASEAPWFRTEQQRAFFTTLDHKIVSRYYNNGWHWEQHATPPTLVWPLSAPKYADYLNAASTVFVVSYLRNPPQYGVIRFSAPVAEDESFGAGRFTSVELVRLP